MVAWASGLGIGLGRFTRPLKGMGVPAMPDVWQDTTRRVEYACEVPLGAGVLRMLVLSMTLEVIIDRCCVADRREVAS
jgi:hypothetical protein